jgi:hypothetical protein
MNGLMILWKTSALDHPTMEKVDQPWKELNV